jgi:hypothetical protein
MVPVTWKKIGVLAMTSPTFSLRTSSGMVFFRSSICLRVRYCWEECSKNSWIEALALVMAWKTFASRATRVEGSAAMAVNRH